jgi:hypothetical protein
MKQQLTMTWNSVMDNRFNPLKYMDLAGRHYAMQLLAWMWSMIFSLSFLSIFHFGYVWLGHLLVIGGVFITISTFQRAESHRTKSEPMLYLSAASKCVWQMDREA